MTEQDWQPEDQLAALRAELDQALALAPELARAARGYFNAFTGQGFSESQATYLTVCQIIDRPLNPPK